MTVASRSLRRAVVLVAAISTLVVVNPAQAQQPPDPGTGASATKNCPADIVTIGQTVTCTFVVQNTGDFPATVTALTEQSPFPSGALINEECVIAGGTVIDAGDTLAPDTPCAGSFQHTIANDPTLCNTFVADRVSIDLTYSQFPIPLFAGAFATEVTLVKCDAKITITKEADALGKIGDPVSYKFNICNVGGVTVNRGSVTDTVLGDLTAMFPASLTAGQCVEVNTSRIVLATDPDPLVNTVTATYTAGTGPFASSATATATDSTNLFQPSLGATKNCAPDPVDVGEVLNCTIVITNTSSPDTPLFGVLSISDTRSGDLRNAANPNIVSSTCGATLAVGASCTIVTRYTVLATDVSPLVNTVTARYSPGGFPNIIEAKASDSVVINPPQKGEGCTPGYWKQDQHFDSWVGFSPNQTLESVFDVPDALGLDNVTLAEALALNGGGVNALLRHAVAALLNAANNDVDFDLTTAQVIAATNAALASGDYETQKNIFAGLNEQGCPLN